jgi:hypothetical protein
VDAPLDAPPVPALVAGPLVALVDELAPPPAAVGTPAGVWSLQLATLASEMTTTYRDRRLVMW